MTVRRAKEFLASQVVQEAEREKIPFSEIERKMLYFSETGWTLPDIMDVDEEFDSSYDRDEYEGKAARLIRGSYARACSGQARTYEEWWASIRTLDKGDHYLSVMIRLAGLRTKHDQLKLFLTAMGLVAVFLAVLLISLKYNLHLGSSPSVPRGFLVRTSTSEYLWVGTVCVLVVYEVLRLVIGGNRTDSFVVWAMKKLVRIWNKVK